MSFMLPENPKYQKYIDSLDNSIPIRNQKLIKNILNIPAESIYILYQNHDIKKTRSLILELNSIFIVDISKGYFTYNEILELSKILRDLITVYEI